jgi:hypothetical protein
MKNDDEKWGKGKTKAGPETKWRVARQVAETFSSFSLF